MGACNALASFRALRAAVCKRCWAVASCSSPTCTHTKVRIWRRQAGGPSEQECQKQARHAGRQSKQAGRAAWSTVWKGVPTPTARPASVRPNKCNRDTVVGPTCCNRDTAANMHTISRADLLQLPVLVFYLSTSQTLLTKLLLHTGDRGKRGEWAKRAPVRATN